MHKQKKGVGLVAKLFIAALVVIAVSVLAVYLFGGRYLKDDDGNKFIGFVHELGPKSGRIYYVGGLTADITASGATVIFRDGTEISDCVTLEFANGEKYEGQLSGLLMDGKGRYTWTNGDVYEGEMENDAHTGEGTVYWEDGLYYRGDMKDGKPDGEGVFLWADVRGEFPSYDAEELLETARNDVAALPEGTWYVGEFANGLKNGYGIYRYSSGLIFAGDFTNDLKNGNGFELYGDGEYYEGEFSADVRSGNGKYVWSDGRYYEGHFADGTLNGTGKYVWPDGTFFEGEFANGERVIENKTENNEGTDN